MLNKAKGNMYSFVTHTWNPIKGKCPHDCGYCFMKRFPQGELRLDEKCFKDNLELGEFIFVGSSTDMFADEVPSEWIDQVLEYCGKFDVRYLFQSKNPERFHDFVFRFPLNTVLGITIETNRAGFTNKAPEVVERKHWLEGIKNYDIDHDLMVSIEPIMDFDLSVLVGWIKEIYPWFVSIGADSKGHNLPEPSAEKVRGLIRELKKFTNVVEKDNLERLFR